MKATTRSIAAIFGLALGLSLLAGAPALRGERILDDAILAPGPTNDELRDAGLSFRRTSLDDQRLLRASVDDAGVVTYRPITMHSLVTTQALFGTMTAHHVVSLVLHALTAFFVGLVLLRSGRPAYLAAIGTGLVAAHPALVEGWVYVAGRADLLAGLCIALAALAFPSKPVAATWPRFALGAVALFAGTLSKETFVFLGPAIAVRAAFGGGTRRARVGRALVVLVPLFAAMLVWEKVRAATPVGLGATDALAWLRKAPRILGDATTTLVVPWARPMRSLAYELSTPTGAKTILGALVLGLGLAVSLAEKRWALVLAIVGSVASLVPLAIVADSSAIGFDRHLTMPLVAITLVALESLEVRETLPRPALAASLVALVALGAVAHVASRAFVNEGVLTKTMRAERPQDPTGFLLEGERLARLGRLRSAATMLRVAPASTVPPIERERASLYQQLGNRSMAIETLENLVRARPDDPLVAVDSIEVDFAERRFDRLADHAEIAGGRSTSRRRACRMLDAYRPGIRSLPAERREPYDRARRILRCDGYAWFDRRGRR